MNSVVTFARKAVKFVAKKYKPYRFKPLKPRGALTRPLGAHLSVEIFAEKPGQYPVVHITAEAHGKIRALVAACHLEIAWLSPTKVTPDGQVVIYDVLVPHQVCTAGSTIKLETEAVDGEDLLLCELMNQGKHQMIKDLICWGHSHVNFGTFPSPTDEEQTMDYLRRMHGMGKTRFVRVIANKGDDLFASLYLLDEGKAIHHAPIKAEPSDVKLWRAWARREVRKKVTEKICPPPAYYEDGVFEYFHGYAPGSTQIVRQGSPPLQTTGAQPATATIGVTQPCPPIPQK